MQVSFSVSSVDSRHESPNTRVKNEFRNALVKSGKNDDYDHPRSYEKDLLEYHKKQEQVGLSFVSGHLKNCQNVSQFHNSF